MNVQYFTITIDNAVPSLLMNISVYRSGLYIHYEESCLYVDRLQADRDRH